MRIGGFMKLSLLDYPGQMACIVFTKGCNFRCPFCQNASLVLPGESAENVEPEQVLSYLAQRKNVLDGVVVTGGEPLLQPDLLSFLAQVRALGYRIKLDTNGSFPSRLEEVLAAGLADYVAMDVKQAPARYESACGISGARLVEQVGKSLSLLRASGVSYELRTTVVKGIHTEVDIAALAQWIAGDMPYYLQPYKASAGVLLPERLAPFSGEELERLLVQARVYCPHAQIRG